MSEMEATRRMQANGQRSHERGPAAGVAAWIGAWCSVLALSVWLSQLAPMWLLAAAVGSVAWSVGVYVSRRRLHLFVAGLLWLTFATATGVQFRLNEISGDWEALQPRIEEPLAAALGEALDNLVEQGELAASGAVEAAATYGTDDPNPELFRRLQGLRRENGVSAIALFDADGDAIAWAGDHRGGVPDAARRGTRYYLYDEGPLFSYLYFIRPLDDGTVATAAFLLEASVDPGDGTAPFADRFERNFGARPRFWTPDRARPESVWDWATDEQPILSVSFAGLTQQDWWLRASDLGRRSAALLLLGALATLCAAWYRARHDASGVPVGATVAALLLAPLDQLVGATALFSPLQFVLPGPFDVSLGTLIILLGGVAVWLLAHTRERAHHLVPMRAALALSLVIFPAAVWLIDRSASDGLLASRAAGGFALQAAATLLIAVPLYLVLRHARAPHAARGRRILVARVFGYALPPALGMAILLLWRPDRPLPVVAASAWAIPTALLLMTAGRRDQSRGSLRLWMMAGWLAATASLAFLWPMHMNAELARAERELARLGTQPDPFLDFLLHQFAETASRLVDEGEGGVNLLYHSWVESSLATEGYEARIGLWRAGEPATELNLSEFDALPASVVADILAERDRPAVVHYGGLRGIHYLLAAPLSDGSVVSVAIPPRRQLGGSTSLSRFVLPGTTAVGQRGETLHFVPVGSDQGVEGFPASRDSVYWVRTDRGWRSETLVEMPTGAVHAHLVISTASLPLTLARAVLVTTVLLALLLSSWFIARTIRGDVTPAQVLRGGLLRSFRARLSVTLFFFFLLPTIGFGVISYGAVAREVLRSATSLAQQALDEAATRFATAGFATPRGGGPDLLMYADGSLASATTPEVLELGLFRSWLPPAVHLRFAGGEEMQALEEGAIADSDYLVAYRRIDPARVLAAPIPLASNEITRRQREFRDLTLLGILVGLGLSVFLAVMVGRALSRPLDELSRAATTVGSGDLATRLPETRSDEFGNVYRSFNQMVGRLNRTRAALMRETRRTETIVAEAATGVLALNGAGRVELINPRAAEILGGSVGVGDSLVHDGRSNGSLAAAVTGLLGSPAPEATTEVELDGRTVRMRLRRLSGDGRGVGAVIALEDVTAEVRTARVLAWGEMARQVAHEIKNPLTPIKLSVQHLRRAYHDRRPDFDRILDTNVDSILREIDRLSEISRAFARFGTPSDGAAPLEEVRLEDTIREVLALYRGSSRGPTFGADLPRSPLPPAVARSGELKEVLINLLENAREAVGRSGTIVVAAGRGPIPGWLNVEVRDDGVGIPADQLPIIFEPHFSTQTSGTGLGLAIVKRIVNSWGGEIHVESTPGAGTRFTIRVRSAVSA